MPCKPAGQVRTNARLKGCRLDLLELGRPGLARTRHSKFLDRAFLPFPQLRLAGSFRDLHAVALTALRVAGRKIAVDLFPAPPIFTRSSEAPRAQQQHPNAKQHTSSILQKSCIRC